MRLTPPAPFCFLSVASGGHSAIVNTSGNGDCHIIFARRQRPNTARSVAGGENRSGESRSSGQVMIDFSHANSSKQFKKQMEVGADVAAADRRRRAPRMGVMIEAIWWKATRASETVNR